MLNVMVSTIDKVAGAMQGGEYTHLAAMIGQRFTDLYWWLGMVIILICTGFTFTAGSYIYTYMISKRLEDVRTNHLTHIDDRLDKLEDRVGDA